MGGMLVVWEVGMTNQITKSYRRVVQMKPVSMVLRKDVMALWRGEGVVDRIVWLAV